MRIAVMGAGGVGGYFGGLLARAGNDVTLIARGAHLEAIRSDGLKVKSPSTDFTVPVAATDVPREIGTVELVLFAVKTYQNGVAIPAIRPLVGEDTCLLTLQNGADSYENLASAFGQDRVLPGATYIEARVHSPGVIRQQGEVPRIVFGEVSGTETPRGRLVFETLKAAGIDAELLGDILKELWTKFIFIASLAGVTTAARCRIATLLEYPEVRELLLAALKEAAAVATARGVGLDPDIVEKTMELIEVSARDLEASMHTDLELGRPLELDTLTGAVVRMGREVGVPTPVNTLLYSILLPYKDGVPPS